MDAVSAESGAGGAASRRSSVLVATSDSATRDLLRRILHVGSVDLVDAADGVEAMALAAASTSTSSFSMRFWR